MDGKDLLYLNHTKLNRPAIASDHLHRQHLLDRLDQNRYRPLTLVSAPAGYGKTVLISCWLESCDLPSAWVSIDEGDNDLRMFTAYFIAAVETLFPGACRKSQALLSEPDLPPMAALSSCLLNELDRIEQPYIIALDDYHLITETAVNNLLVEILTFPPRSMYLVEKNVAVNYIGQLLAAFSPTPLSPSPSHPTPQPLYEHLTNRERDILDLLAQRLQSKEIVENLFNSTETVNTHPKNIYRKLDVHNRRQAVVTARTLGILPIR